MTTADNKLNDRVDSLVTTYFATLEARKSHILGKKVRVKQQQRAVFVYSQDEVNAIKTALIWFDDLLGLDRDAPQGMVKLTRHLREDVAAAVYGFQPDIFYVKFTWNVTEFHIATRALELWCEQTSHKKTFTYKMAKNLLRFFEKGKTYQIAEPKLYEDPQGGIS